MVVDTSVVLGIFFNEKHAHWAISHMDKHARELRMSTVNLTEALIHLKDRQPQNYKMLEEKLIYDGIRFVSPDVEQARIAANARIKFPLNLGDCFAYALAVTEDCPILTLDKDFRLLNHPVIHPF